MYGQELKTSLSGSHDYGHSVLGVKDRRGCLFLFWYQDTWFRPLCQDPGMVQSPHPPPPPSSAAPNLSPAPAGHFLTVSSRSMAAKQTVLLNHCCGSTWVPLQALGETQGCWHHHEFSWPCPVYKQEILRFLEAPSSSNKGS